LTGISGKLPEPKFFGLITLKPSSPSTQFYLIYIFAENSAERSLYAAYELPTTFGILMKQPKEGE
jgi:hypothetical protein